MLDKTGRELKVGQVVDVFVSDIVAAYVAEIKEASLADSEGRTRPPQIVLQIIIPMVVREVAPVYIIRDVQQASEGNV